MSLTGNYYQELQDEFINKCSQVYEGELSFIDCASDFKQEIDYLEQLAKDRKDWLSENLDQVTNEADLYGKEGYKGFLFKKQTRETLSFKHIKEWQDLEDKKKSIEEKSKLAYKMTQKGGLNVDENGEEIQLPEVKVTSFMKIDKAK